MKYALAVAALLLAPACRTTSYGRLSPLTTYERDHFSCEDLDKAIAESEAFIAKIGHHLREEAVAYFIDFGVGNSFERRAARESADARIASCKEQKIAKGCP